MSITRSSPVQVAAYSTTFSQAPKLVSTSWSKISVGPSHVLAIRSNNTLYAWGFNNVGQLGDGTTISRSSPVQIGNPSIYTWTDIVAGLNFSVGLRGDNLLFTWGLNTNGQLGDLNAGTSNRSSPIQVGTSSWNAVSAGGSHVVAIRSDKSLWAWGLNSLGQLGTNDLSTRSSPVQISSSSWSIVSAGNTHTTAITTDGKLYTWGDNTVGTLGYTIPPQTYYSWTSVAGNADYTVAIRNDGLLFAWGTNNFGQLGDFTTINRSSPVQIGSNSWSVVTANAPTGGGPVLAIRSDGTLWGWGYNVTGVLGLGDTAYRSSPVQVSGGGSWIAVASSKSHTVALKSDYNLYTWGLGTSGQLGDGLVSRSSPVKVGTSNWTKVSAGDTSSYAIKNDNQLYTWGAGTDGRLGLTDTVSRSSPVQISSKSWTSVFAYGSSFVHAIDSNNKLFAWGLGTTGQLGYGDAVSRSSPVQISTGNFSTLGAYGTTPNTLGIQTDGSLWGWGIKTNLLLGDFSSASYTYSWSQVSAGPSHTGAIRSDGRLYTWGYNRYGQLGNNSTVNTSSPTLITTILSGDRPNEFWNRVSVNDLRTVAVRNDGTLWTWGFNAGILGISDITNRSKPIQIGNSITTEVSNSNIYSTYFNGTSDYISTVTTPANLGTSDFTVEGWFYFNTNTNGYKPIIASAGTADQQGWILITETANQLALYFSNGSAWTYNYVSTYIPQINVWTHLAIVRLTTTITLYANGTALGTTVTPIGANSVSVGSTAFYVGYYPYFPGGPRSFSGYISNVRITNGVGVYTGNFTVPTAPLTATQSAGTNIAAVTGTQTSLLTLQNLTIIDNAVSPFTITAIGDPYPGQQFTPFPSYISATRSWTSLSAGTSHTVAINSLGRVYTWGDNTYQQLGYSTSSVASYSVLFDGNPQYMRIDGASGATTAFTFGTNDFTVEAWVYLNFYPSPNSGFLAGNATTANGFGFGIYRPLQQGKLYMTTSTTEYISTGSTIPLKTWVHVAWTRQSNTVRMFINGVLDYNAGTISTNITETGGNLGGNAGGNSFHPGWVSNLRVVNNQALYTSAFTPSTSQLTKTTVGSTGAGAAVSLTGTVTLLTFQSSAIVDNSNSNNLLVLLNWSGPTTGQIVNPFQQPGVPVQITVPSVSWSQVSSYSNHNLAIDTNNKLYSWGDNTLGQAGQSTNPLQWTSVNNYYTTQMIRNDGIVYVMGLNNGGQLGDATTVNKSSPVQLSGGGSWNQIVSGYDGTNNGYSIGIKTDGTLYAWGLNSSGILGDSTLATTVTRSSPVQVGTSSWISVSTMNNSAIAIRSDYTMWAWGKNDIGQLGQGDTTSRSSPVQIGTSSWTQVSVGVSSAMAIKLDTTLWVWGLNANGQLGDSTTVNKSSPIQLGVGNSYIQIAGKSSSKYAIRNDYTLWSWGFNTNGELGLLDAVARSSPVQINTAYYYDSVSSGADHAIAKRRDGTIWSWGLNTSGQLGDSTTVAKSSPVAVGTSSWISVSAGYKNTFGITSSALNGLQNLYAWGYNVNGDFGLVDTTYRSSPVQIGSGLQLQFISSPTQIGTSSWTTISAGLSNSMAIRSDYKLYTWGDNSQLQSGYITPTTILSTSNKTNNDAQSYIRSTDNALIIWGVNDVGQLGDGSIANKSNPVQLGVGFGNSRFAKIARAKVASAGYTLGIKTDGTLWSWGSGVGGVLGSTTTTNRSSPGVVSTLTNWSDVAAGPSHALAIKTDGSLWGWGLNTSGQAGVLSWAKVSSGSSHTLAIRSDGALYGWGSNTVGQVGDNSVVNRSSPVQIGTGFSWNTISAGINISAAVRGDNRLFTWGLNTSGQLGLGDATTNRSSPVQVSIGNSSWTQVSARDYMMALTTTGRLYTWGTNTNGQLGDGTTTNKSSPGELYPPVYYKSLFINGQGSGSNITTASNANLALGPTDHTVEFWVYQIDNSAASGNFIDRPIASTGTTSQWGIDFGHGNYNPNNIQWWSVQLDNAQNYQAFGSLMATTKPANWYNNWHHIAVTRKITTNSVYTMYLDGVQVSTYTHAGVGDFSTDTTLQIDYRVYGYMRDIRITKSLVYTGNFNVPTSALTALPNTVLLVNLGSTVPIDYSTNNIALTVNNVTVPYTYPTVYPSTFLVGDTDWSSNFTTGTASLATKTSGALYAWGLNTSGQLGLNDVVSRSSPVQVGTGVNASSWSAISSSNNAHTLGLTVDGKLYAWGNNFFSQLGLNDTVNRSSPVQVGSSSWTNVYAGTNYSIALRTDNTVFAWGDNTRGNLGVYNLLSWTIIGNGIGIHSDYTLWNWGDNSVGQLGISSTQYRSSPVQIGTTSWTYTYSTTSNAYAIKSDGSMWSWGRNYVGQLGLGDTTDRSSPVQIGTDTNWSTVVASATGHALAIKTTGTLWAWGYNQYNELGQNQLVQTNRSAPVQVGSATTWTKVSAGNNYSLGISAFGLWAWGRNDWGQTGNPSNIPLSWTTVAGGDSYSVAIRSDGKLFSWGKNDKGQLGLGHTVNKSAPTQIAVSTNYNLYSTQFTGDTGTFLTLPYNAAFGAGTSDFTLEVWIYTTVIGNDRMIIDGGNNAGGRATTSHSLYLSATGTIIYLPGGTAVINAGLIVANTWTHIAVVRISGSTKLYINGIQTGNTYTDAINYGIQQPYIGRNCDGSVNPWTGYISNLRFVKGTGLYTTTFTPPISILTNITNTSFLICQNDRFIDNATANSGVGFTLTPTGTGITTSTLTPFQTTVYNYSFTQISTLISHTVAIRNDGTLWSWGANDSGQLGQGDIVPRSAPLQVGSSSWTNVFAGPNATYAVRTDGGLFTAGDNTYGILGQGDTVSRSSLVQLGTSSWTSISSSLTGHTLGITNTGALYGWGYNQYNELGLNESNPLMRSSPVQVGTSSWTKVSAGNNFSLAISSNNLLWAWGRNEFGQVPPATGTVLTALSWTTVAGGDSYSVAIRSDGKLFSWGLNNKGQLGLGHTVNKSAPTQIAVSTNYNLYSTQFNGTTDVLTFGANNANLAVPGDFTFEFWFYTTIAIPAGEIDFFEAQTTGAFRILKRSTSSGLSYDFYGGTAYLIVADANIPINYWNHVAVSRTSGTLSAYFNGVRTILQTDNTVGVTPTVNYSVGGRTSAINLFTGYISNVRLIKGTGIYSGTGISIPSSPLTAVTNTQLLMCQNNTYIDNAASIAITPIGTGITTSTLTPFQTTVYNYSFTQVSATLSHVLAIRTDGALFSWGDNTSGQLGQSNTTTRSAPIQIGSSSWTQVAAGSNNSFAIRTDGALFAWGDNTNGILGQSDTITRSSPVQIGSSSWTSVSATQHAVGITTANTMFAWGLNTTGQLGDTTTASKSSPVQVQAGFPSSLLVYNSATVVDNSGNSVTMTATGSPTVGSTIIPFSSTNSVNFPTNTYYTTGSLPALGTQYTFEFWAYVTAVPAGNWYWQIVGGSVPMFYFVGNGSAITSIGKINNGGGGAFLGSVTLNLNTWAHIAYTRNSANLMTIWLNGSSIATSSDSSSYTGGAALIGYPAGGNGGTGAGYMSNYRFINNSCLYTNTFTPSTTTLTATALLSSLTYTRASAGTSHSVAIRNDSGLYTWGSGVDGRLGNGLTTNRSFAVQIGASNWTQINAGSSWTLGVLSTGGLYSWGAGVNGELGSGATASRSSPVQVGALTTWGVLSGKTHALSITTAGALFTWGTNTAGQLGNNSTTVLSSPVGVASLSGFVFNSQSSPTQIGASNWTQIQAGTLWSAAILTNGALFTWGFGVNGELASGATTALSSPVQVGALTTWGKLAGTTHVLGTLTTGTSTLVAWGTGNIGQLGNYTVTSVSSPVAVSGLLTGLVLDNLSSPTQIGASSWTQLSAGDAHGMALRIDSGLFTWGKADYGQLGSGNSTHRSSPVQVGSTSWSQISAGNLTSAAITTLGSLQTWGRNNIGQLGSATTTDRNAPAAVGTSSWTSVSASKDGMFAVTILNQLFAWGNNNIGQLGVGDTAYRSSPVQVGSNIQTLFSNPTQISASVLPNTNSVYFNGTNDYLALASNAAFAFGTGNFTIECWVYSNSIASTQAIFDTRTPDTANIGFDFFLTSSTLRFGTNATTYIIGSTTLLSNTWYHVAISRSGTTTYQMFLNGLQEGSTYTTSQNFTNNTVRIGNGVNGFFNGYISNLRVITGQGLYTNTFTPSKTALTNNTVGSTGSGAAGSLSGTVVLLTCQSTTFVDNSTNNFALQVAGMPLLIGASYTQVSAGESNTVLINTTGVLFNTGDDTTGQMGDSTTVNKSFLQVIANPTLYDNRSSPAQIGTGSWSQIAVGLNYSVALASNGTLYTWGDNTTGYLGDGTTLTRRSMTQIGTSSYTSISSGGSHTVALKLDKTLYAWGLNNAGQLGDNSVVSRSSPVQVNTGLATSWNFISAGASHTSALDSTYNLPYGWGLNSSGQLGDSTVVSRSAPVQVNTASLQNYSYQFNGSNQYLTSAASASNQLTSNFTIEFWFYAIALNGGSGSGLVAINDAVGPNSSTGLSIFLDTGGILTYFVNGNGGGVAGPTIVISTWYHVALVRSGSTNTLYLNGVSRATSSTTPAWSATPSIGIGRVYNDNASFVHNGYISNVRIVKGTALYTSGFYPSTGSLTTASQGATANQVLLLTAQSATIVDNSINLTTFTNTGTVTSSTSNPFGPYYSGNFSGSNYLSVTNNSSIDLATGAPDWTIECWFNTTTSGVQRSIIQKDGISGSRQSQYSISISTGNQINLTLSTAVNAGGNQNFVGGSISASTWYHVAAVRSGSNITVFLNGAIIAGPTALSTTLGNNTGDLTIGMNTGPADFFTGYISNLRIVKGTAVYTGSFTPPTNILRTAQSAMTNMVALTGTETILLTLQNATVIDNSASPLTITNNNSVVMTTPFAPFSASGVIVYTAWDSIQAGVTSTMGTSNNTLYTWGAGTNGQLGNNTVTGISAPSTTGIGSIWSVAEKLFSSPVQVGTANSWSLVSAGAGHTVAMATDYSLWAWGQNTIGQTGDSTTVGKSSPTQIAGNTSSYTFITAGVSDTFAIRTTTNLLFAWGLNTAGQLGLNDTANRSSPVQVFAGTMTSPLIPIRLNTVSGSSYTVVQAGSAASVIDSLGRLFTWGTNTNGQLGDNTTTNRSSPVQLGGLTGFTYSFSPIQVGSSSYSQVSAGYSHTLAIGITGSLYAWGKTPANGATVTRSSPVQIGSNSWLFVSAGIDASQAIDSTRTLYAWGLNTNYQLGSASFLLNQSVTSPVAIGTLAINTASHTNSVGSGNGGFIKNI